MQFVTYEHEGQPTVGALANGMVFSLAALGFASMSALIAGSVAALTAISNRNTLVAEQDVPLNSVKVLAPLPHPPRIFCIGLNYASDASESQMKVQSVPTVFMKLSSFVVGPGADVILPYNSTQPDFEAEFAVVIGKGGYRIPAAAREEHVFGYAIVNDVSARDVQLATSQWTLGKSFPTFTPWDRPSSLVTRSPTPMNSTSPLRSTAKRCNAPSRASSSSASRSSSSTFRRSHRSSPATLSAPAHRKA